MAIYDAVVLRRAYTKAQLPALLQPRQAGLAEDTGEIAFKGADGTVHWFYNQSQVNSLLSSASTGIWKGSVATASGLPGGASVDDVWIVEDTSSIVRWSGSAWVTLSGVTSLTWRGPWVSGGSYSVQDLVSYAGNIYICTAPYSGTDDPATATSYWELFLSFGDESAPAFLASWDPAGTATDIQINNGGGFSLGSDTAHKVFVAPVSGIYNFVLSETISINGPDPYTPPTYVRASLYMRHTDSADTLIRESDKSFYNNEAGGQKGDIITLQNTFSFEMSAGDKVYNESTLEIDSSFSPPIQVWWTGFKITSSVAIEGAASYLELDDTESSYAGYAGHFPRINAGEAGLDWSSIYEESDGLHAEDIYGYDFVGDEGYKIYYDNSGATTYSGARFRAGGYELHIFQSDDVGVWLISGGPIGALYASTSISINTPSAIFSGTISGTTATLSTSLATPIVKATTGDLLFKAYDGTTVAKITGYSLGNSFDFEGLGVNLSVNTELTLGKDNYPNPWLTLYKSGTNDYSIAMRQNGFTAQYFGIQFGIDYSGDYAGSGIIQFGGANPGSVEFSRTGDINFWLDGSITVGGTTTAIRPLYDNAYTIGSSSYRWSNVYTQLLNVAGTATFAAINATSITLSGALILADAQGVKSATASDLITFQGGSSFGNAYGATFYVSGISHPSFPGSAKLTLGNVAGAQFQLRDKSGVDGSGMKMDENGLFTFYKAITATTFQGTTITATTGIVTPGLQASSSAGLVVNNSSGTLVATFGAGSGTGVTFAGAITGTSATFSGALTGTADQSFLWGNLRIRSYADGNSYGGIGLASIWNPGASSDTSFGIVFINNETRINSPTASSTGKISFRIENTENGYTNETGRLYWNGSISIALASAYFFGDPDTDTSWRQIRVGNNLEFQRRESGVWVTKSTITA